MEEFFKWLKEETGTFRGAPLPNWALLVGLLLIYTNFIISLIKIVRKKLREKKDNSLKKR
jgi:hypothetical protein